MEGVEDIDLIHLLPHLLISLLSSFLLNDRGVLKGRKDVENSGKFACTCYLLHRILNAC